MAKKRTLHKSLLSLPKLKKQPSSYYYYPYWCNYQNAPSPPPMDGADRGATLSDIDRYLFENFNSLYSPGRDAASASPVGPTDFSPRFTDPPAEDVRPSKRFFVTPVPTGSLVEEARLSAASEAAEEVAAGGGATAAVVTVSADPYVDFRLSMHEMVDARKVDKSGPLDWGFLENLLACYLELNERSVHECILRAFMDLTEELRRQREDENRKMNVRDGYLV